MAARRFRLAACSHGLLIAAIAPESAVASDELDLYGKINVTLQNSDEAADEEVELQAIPRASA